MGLVQPPKYWYGYGYDDGLDPLFLHASLHPFPSQTQAICCNAPKPGSDARSAVHVIDMRSDTVTKPTEEMRRAMFEAEVGDDVFGDDPTVQALERSAAEMLGKEAALFVPSGTMANLLSVMVHCSRRGDEVLLGELSHISKFEQGGIAQLAGVHPRTVRNLPDGRLDLEDLRSKIQTNLDPHMTVTRLVCLENTHNYLGGRVLSIEHVEKVAEILKGTGIKIHMDGARLFNAATALSVPAAALVRHADSVYICLSKGLGAPIGSLLVGGRDFINSARRQRKAVGGGMRQAGVIAAPAIVALEKMSKRLQVDHDNAQRLARGLAGMESLGVHIDVASTETNIVLFTLNREDISPTELVRMLASTEDRSMTAGEVCVKIVAFPDDPRRLRVTIHHHITESDIDCALTKMGSILRGR